MPDEAEMDAACASRSSRACRRSPGPRRKRQHVKAALRDICRRPSGRSSSPAAARAPRAPAPNSIALAESAANPGRDLAQRQGTSIPGAQIRCRVGVVGSYSRESANRAVNRADLVCFIGTETGGMTTQLLGGTEEIRSARDPDRHWARIAWSQLSAAGKRIGRRQSVLIRMLGQIDKASAAKRAAWIKEIAALRGDWYAKYKPMLESDAAPIHPARICGELTRHMPDDAIVVVDTGHAGMWMGGMYDLRAPTQSYMRSAGHLGWAFPAGIGAKAACPDRPVVVFTGDAGFWYHIGEVETAVRWNLASVTIVNNNGGGNQSKRGFDRAYGGEQTAQARELWTYNKMNFAKLAEDMGALGIRVERPGDIAPRARRRGRRQAACRNRRRYRYRSARADRGGIDGNFFSGCPI